ncbi:MAG: TlpA disulfide reductase family protein, partial [Schlesneria sp.]
SRTEKRADGIAEKNAPQAVPDTVNQSVVVGLDAQAAEIRQAIIDAAEKLVDLKIDVVERGSLTQRTDDIPVPVAFKQMWMHASSAQLRMVSLDEKNEEEWWTGFDSIKGPITTGHLASLSGFKACIDMSREIAFANSTIRGKRPEGTYQTVHSVSQKPRLIFNLFVPLVELNKPWISADRQAGSPVINAICRLPVSAWHVVGDEKLADEETILVEIDQHDTVKIPLNRHEGTLNFTQIYRVWCSRKYGMIPLRIEQAVRYGLQGRDYRQEPRADGLALLVYEASDFTQFGDVWVPRLGRQSSYQAKEPSEQGFDPDSIADKLIAEGKASFSDELKLGYEYEWRILKLEQIDPELNLWFEPQAGAEVINMDTHKRSVQGDTVASEKYAARERAIEARVGQPVPEFPEEATWLNGEPLSWTELRGKVVIMDFWADWCGPCRRDLPQLRVLHDEREINGLTIIGIHLEGSELASIKKAVSDHQLEYPICIDVKKRLKPFEVEMPLFPGEFSSQFGIDSIPHFVVVDQQGVVAASHTGAFEDALEVAKRLVKEAK